MKYIPKKSKVLSLCFKIKKHPEVERLVLLKKKEDERLK